MQPCDIPGKGASGTQQAAQSLTGGPWGARFTLRAVWLESVFWGSRNLFGGKSLESLLISSGQESALSGWSACFECGGDCREGMFYIVDSGVI